MSKFLFAVLALGAFAMGQSPESVVVPDGTAVRLRFAESIRSRTAIEGDFVPLVLAEDLVVNGRVVAPSGSPAVGTVSSGRKAEMMGQCGHLNIRAEYIKVGSQRVRVIGKQAVSGEEKVGTSIVLTVLFGPIGLIKRGRDVEIPKGSLMNAYVNAPGRISAKQP